jgi:Tfp pilus assembly protein PilF
MLDKALEAAPHDATILLHRAQIALKENDATHAYSLIEEAQKYLYHENEHLLVQKIIKKHPRH